MSIGCVRQPRRTADTPAVGHTIDSISHRRRGSRAVMMTDGRLDRAGGGFPRISQEVRGGAGIGATPWMQLLPLAGAVFGGPSFGGTKVEHLFIVS